MLMARGLIVATIFFTMTPLLIAVQWLLVKLRLPGWGVIGVNYYRVLCLGLRIRVRVVGEPVRDRAVLFVSNHVSWADILAIGSITPIAYVSKSEIAKWPLVGTAAKIAAHGVRRPLAPPPDRRRHRRDRPAAGRRHLGGAVRGRHLERRQPRAAVPLGAGRRGQGGERARRERHPDPADVDLLHRLNGIPMGRQHRPTVAWYGDLDFMPHIKAFIARGAVDAVVSYGEPMAADGTADRKAMTRSLEGAVRTITSATLRGRPRPLHAGS